MTALMTRFHALPYPARLLIASVLAYAAGWLSLSLLGRSWWSLTAAVACVVLTMWPVIREHDHEQEAGDA